MNEFANLFALLDQTTKTSSKIDALRKYFEHAPPEDAAWAVYFLIGRRPRQIVKSGNLRAWATLMAGVSPWLFQECYDAVGDVAETIALLLPPSEHGSHATLRYWIEERLLPLRGQSEESQRAALFAAWEELNHDQRFLWNKLLGGAFRVGVSQQLVIRALAEAGGIDAAAVAHRLMGNWEPTPSFFASVLAHDATDTDLSRPYQFFLAYAIDRPVESLGERALWQAEWKWDGIRCQLIRRGGQTFLWSRGEELVTERYPEIAAIGDLLPDGTAIDGELLPWRDERPLPFAELQRRIGRKSITRAILTQVPVIVMAYDVLEFNSEDIRAWPLAQRRSTLTTLVETIDSRQLRLSPIVRTSGWDDLKAEWTKSRQAHAEGLMLKRLDSAYGAGRRRGDWWKWKVEAHTIDAVLTAAQRGSGKRASLYTDYTFGVWDAGALVTIAKAYSGLTDAEIRQVDAFIRRNMIEKFGPVRTVKPELVFELAFEGLNLSKRHKSGIAVRFPRIIRMRQDKSAVEADTLDNVRALLADQASEETTKVAE
jgi:DNA ligase-1